MISFALALLALASVAVLALFPGASSLAGPQMGPDRATLWFLFVCSVLVAWVPALWKRLQTSRDASTWALICAFFVLFHIADRAGPANGWALTLPFAREDPVPISYAARAVLLGALCSFPLWMRRGGAEKAIVVALAVVGAFGLGTLWFLGRFYPVGADQDLAPRPVATLLVQAVSYGALALCCRAVTENEQKRAFVPGGCVMKLLPLVLLGVVLRHQIAPIPAPAPTSQDDE